MALAQWLDAVEEQGKELQVAEEGRQVKAGVGMCRAGPLGYVQAMSWHLQVKEHQARCYRQMLEQPSHRVLYLHWDFADRCGT